MSTMLEEKRGEDPAAHDPGAGVGELIHELSTAERIPAPEPGAGPMDEVAFPSLATMASEGVKIRPPRWKRAIKSLKPTQIVMIGVLALIIIAAVAAPLLAPYSPTTNDLLARLSPPAWLNGGSLKHILGTDQLGRDVLSRIMYGGRVSLVIALVGSVLGAALGAAAGLVAGFWRGAIDDVVMLIVDAYVALPFIIIALSVIAVTGASFQVMIFLAAVAGFAGYTRIARSLALQIKEQPYVTAARSFGARPVHILIRHALPNILAPMIVLITMEMSSIILMEASLSFLGFGIQPPTPAWGLMVNEGRDYLASSWWVGVFPGIAIMLLATSISLLGDWVRDVFDPTSDA